MDETQHEVLRRNVVTATRIYQARVNALMQEIIRHPSNPLSVKHFASKLEFQARGAGHNHGVLWLDIDKIEQKVDIRYFKKNYDSFENHFLMDPKDVKELDDFTTNELMLKLDKKSNPGRMHKALRYLRRLEQIKVIRNITEEHEIHIQKLQKIFPLFGLKTILCKLQKNEEVTDEELAVIVTFVDSFCTVSLHPAIVGSIVAEIAKKVNQHHHTQTCRKFKTVCRFNMPKLPSYETIIARPPMKEMSAKDRSSLKAKHAVILKKKKRCFG